MGHEFLSPLRKVDVLAGLHETIETVIEIDDTDEAACLSAIREKWPALKESGYLCFTQYHHKTVGQMKAVEKTFSLMDVSIFPDGVAVIEKRTGVRCSL